MKVQSKPDRNTWRMMNPKFEEETEKRLNSITKEIKTTLTKQKEELHKDKVELSKEAKDILKDKEKQKLEEAKKRMENKEKSDENKDVGETNKSATIKDLKKMGTIRTPAIFFIEGFHFLSADGSGIKKMAEVVNGARYYGWDQKADMIKDIAKRHPDASVILVGHGLGGDTAVEVANELNKLDNGFRSVDLLVTIDSVGSDNDIIPQNVKKNLNIFGEKDFFVNDGPNVARNDVKTEVINDLRPEYHDEMDQSEDIQFQVIESIRKALKKHNRNPEERLPVKGN